MTKKILIFGRTGAGKTTLANALQKVVGGVVLDGDAIRDTDPNPIGFGAHDRWAHAVRMSKLADVVTASGNNAICSFVCPTAAMRKVFDADYTIWIDAFGDGKYPDTQAMFEEPTVAEYDGRAHRGHPPEYWAGVYAPDIQPVFNPRLRTGLLVGRWQPFHAGHKALVESVLAEYGQVCIGVRDTDRFWSFDRVKTLIDHNMREHTGRYTVAPLPNITAICYGRDVGYEVKQLHLSPEIEKISGTTQRELHGYPICA